ncbi:MAG: T9SS type A sorting domain-containing protein [Chlorobi bacterium]|nr:T9SS type A sorting domain-containing protein [Chlorobiota bacterium]
MKRFILMLSALFVFAATAQQRPVQPLSQVMGMKNAPTDIFQAPARPAARPATVYTALDSIWYVFFGQLVITETFGYDQAGNKNFYEHLSYNGGSPMMGIRELWNHDAQNRIIRYEEQEYESSGGVWYTQFSQDYFYDAAGRLDSIMEWDHTSAASPVPSKAYKVHYNASNLRDTVYIYAYDNGTGTWALSERELYTYDGANRLFRYILQEYNQGQWLNDMKFLYLYDGSGKLVDIYSYSWNAGWQGDTWYHGHYTNRLLDTLYYYENSNGAWELMTKEMYEYDSFLNWSRFYQEDHVYGAVMLYRYRPVYDNSVSYSQMLPMNYIGSGFFYDDSQLFRHKLDTLYADQYNGSSWDNLGVITYYYSQRNLKVNDPQTFALRVYPNPARGIFHVLAEPGVRLLEVTLFDLNGRPVRKWEDGQTLFSVSNLKSGLYLLRIRTNRGSTVRKLILE